MQEQEKTGIGSTAPQNDRNQESGAAHGNGSESQSPASKTAPPGQQELPQLSLEEELERMAGELADARAKAQEHYDAYLRAVAEMENIRRRAQEDVAKAHKYGVEGFAESLLPVIDSLNAALADQSGDTAKMREGVELTLKQLTSAFEKYRLTEINPVGEKFDPHRHQAISTQPVEHLPPNHVITVLQKGYAIADRVLRPALVIVSQGNS